MIVKAASIFPRVLVLAAAVWAIVSPAAYGFLFAVGGHWSAPIDLAVVLACLFLGVSAFRPLPIGIWIAAFVMVAAASLAGAMHHFEDSGESGPLPFEWVNGYFKFGFPLLIFSLAFAFRSTRGGGMRAAISSSR